MPEHKKKTPKKGKAPVELRLNVQPGEMYMVAMKGYQPWPVIVADEDMLPEALLSKRPVSAKRLDGTYRDDFKEGGKNAKDRRYPVMFLGTNELWVSSDSSYSIKANSLTVHGKSTLSSSHSISKISRRPSRAGIRRS